MVDLDLNSNEIDLVGNWIMQDGRMIADAVERRIQKLTSQRLQKIAIGPESGGWETLYRDPVDLRFWELTYPKSEMHGGGPRRLKHLPDAMAAQKYRLDGHNP